MITAEDVFQARELIRGRTRLTPILEWSPNVFLKLEQLQYTGTFKARGAFVRQLRAIESGALDPQVGVVAASGGNAGLAHAFVARELGHPAEIYVPGISSPAKVTRLGSLGAQVHQVGQVYDDAFDASQRRVAETGAVFCHAYDQPDVVAGAGTLGLEFQEQVAATGAGLDTVVVSVGGGGLLAGLIAGLDPSIKIVAVETQGCNTLNAALEAGEPTDVVVSGVAADSLGARRIGELAWAGVSANRERIVSVLVSDDAVLNAQRELWDQARLVSEPAAATALAALSSGAYVPAPGERVGVVICGANTDPSSLAN